MKIETLPLYFFIRKYPRTAPMLHMVYSHCIYQAKRANDKGWFETTYEEIADTLPYSYKQIRGAIQTLKACGLIAARPLSKKRDPNKKAQYVGLDIRVIEYDKPVPERTDPYDTEPQVYDAVIDPPFLGWAIIRT